MSWISKALKFIKKFTFFFLFLQRFFWIYNGFQNGLHRFSYSQSVKPGEYY